MFGIMPQNLRTPKQTLHLTTFQHTTSMPDIVNLNVSLLPCWPDPQKGDVT
jgi:hypothetical protein